MGDRASVVPQWLELPANAGNTVQSQDWEIPRAVRQLSLCATASEARTTRAHALQQKEAVAGEAHASQQESGLHWLQPKKKRKSNGVNREAYVLGSPCRVLLSVSFTFSFKYLISLSEDGDTPK